MTHTHRCPVMQKTSWYPVGVVTWPNFDWGAKQAPCLRSLSPLQWRYKERHCVSNHQQLYCLLNRLFWLRSKKRSKVCDTGLCEENPWVTGGFPSQRASYTESVFIWWHHNAMETHLYGCLIISHAQPAVTVISRWYALLGKYIQINPVSIKYL